VAAPGPIIAIPLSPRGIFLSRRVCAFFQVNQAISLALVVVIPKIGDITPAIADVLQ
jgi:hypothetical protein